MSQPPPPDTRRPQAEQMAHESMVRTLAAQALAIWPQERALFERVPPRDGAWILDVGCGTGELALRLSALFPRAHLVGVDLLASHLQAARERFSARSGLASGVVQGDAFHLPFAPARFDLTVCRHMLQAVPEPERVLAELVRVTRPGGRLHLIAEDYGMIHMSASKLDIDRFWFEGPLSFGKATGTDLHIGRRVFTLLRALPVEGIRIDYVSVDTLRVPRETFAAIWEAWRDGYTDAIAEHTRFTRDEVRAFFAEMIACIRDPNAYALWQVPVVSAVVR